MFHKGFLESEFDWTGYLLPVTLPKCLEYFEIIWTRIPPKKYWSKDQRMVTTSFPAMSHIMPPYQRYCCLNHQTPSQVPVARNSASSTSRSSSPWVKLLTSRCALVLVEREQQVNIGDFSASNMGIQPSKMMISPSKMGIEHLGLNWRLGLSRKGGNQTPKYGQLGKFYGERSNLGVGSGELNSSRQLV